MKLLENLIVAVVRYEESNVGHGIPDEWPVDMAKVRFAEELNAYVARQVRKLTEPHEAENAPSLRQ